MPRPRVAILGAAKGIAGRHLDAYESLGDRADLAAVCDLDSVLGPDVARRHNVRFYADPGELLAKEDIDVLDVCTPDRVHCENVILGLSAGCHVLCEKPLALSEDEIAHMRAAAERAGRVVMPAMMQRFAPRHEAARRLIEEGRIGAPVFGRYTWRGKFFPYPEGSFYRRKESLGQFVHNGIHYLDLMCYLMGTRPESVFALTTEHFGEDRMETPNYHLASYRMANGALVEVEYNQLLRWRTRSRTRVHVVGDRGSLLLTDADDAVRVTGPGGLDLRPAYVGDAEADPFRREIEHFLDVVEGRAEPRIPFEDACAIMEAVIATVRSAERGEPVELGVGR